MQNEQKSYSILDYKTFIFGIFSKCNQSNQELAFSVVKTMYENTSSLSRKDINHLLGVDVSYSIIKRLEEYNIIIKTEGSNKMMLVDNGVSDMPAYGRDKIQEMTMKSFKNLLKDSADRGEINKIIEDYFIKNNIFERPKEEMELIKIYNKIFDIIVTEGFYNSGLGYGRLDRRPQRVNKYILNHELLQTFGGKKENLSIKKIISILKMKQSDIF